MEPNGLRRFCTPGFGDVETEPCCQSRIWKKVFPPALINPARGCPIPHPSLDHGHPDSTPGPMLSLPNPGPPAGFPSKRG
jgi:hypothetical protein